MIASIVYLLCALTSLGCAALLLLKYRRNRVPLLFWSSLCFVGFAVNNIILFIDLIVVPELDLSLVRTVPALIGVMLLLWGFVWDSA
jgi:hypothetical protein